jgi:hypothetical protein
MGEQTNFIKVVVMRDGKPYRTEVLKSTYLGEDGKIRLPENTYSAGWCHRVWDVVWEDLEPLEN